ncbi:MAG: Deoxyribose-phosphate aldolase [Syntrophorhabdaceae bacterium]|nr:Deoxyribose-phosphate aldolase [Syntrophorhabdaceae bacterium]
MTLDERINRIIAEEMGRVPHAPKCNWCWVCPDCKTEVVSHIVRNGAARVGANPGLGPLHDGLAKTIDHTLLKAEATQAQVETLCQEAAEYDFASVCINPTWVPLSYKLLRGTSVMVCTVIGFPLGATTTESKAFEAHQAVECGAAEIDMVINIGRLKSGDYDAVEHDIYHVVRASAPAHVKVIIETCYLTDEEKIKACVLAQEAGAHFVKTSTGFGSGGAKIEDIALMRHVVGEYMGVKASGGIREYETAAQMLEAGASRLGASASVAIVEKKKAA